MVLDVMVYAAMDMNSVNAEVPCVSLLGDTFSADPSGFRQDAPRHPAGWSGDRSGRLKSERTYARQMSYALASYPGG
jgi:hypothetical protein